MLQSEDQWLLHTRFVNRIEVLPVAILIWTGTFQQYTLGPANYVTPIPESLDSADAAPMLCAGVTVYSALRKSGAKSGDWIALLGAGGGVRHTHAPSLSP
jgi:D-arabinose 1-dehydrogenase-like Zn-dependent alcohol dehydrogenase